MAHKRRKTLRLSAETRFLLREAQTKDLDAIYALAEHLDSVNMPHDHEVLSRIMKRVRKSFRGDLPPDEREYMFLAENVQTGAIVGTSMVYARKGRKSAPHVFFDVVEDERYSSTLDRHFSHVTLRLGFNYSGPTEIGALVLDPGHRSVGLGKPLSFVRFLFVAMYRDRFQPAVIAELLPPLERDGRSKLWEHLGRHFTGLSYQEADKLSHSNKEFIYALFPQSPLYASLLPPDVRKLIGEVGEETKPVRRMLEQVGFRYNGHIDPFDGGPHFEARTLEIETVSAARRLRLSREVLEDDADATILTGGRGDEYERRLLATGRPEGPPQFRSIVAAARIEGGSLIITPQTRALLKAKPGQDVWATPL